MPTTTGRNLIYRIALPILAPRIHDNSPRIYQGYALSNSEALNSVLRRNHISGAAICIKDGQRTAEVFTSAVHTRMLPDKNTYYRVASITKMATAMITYILADKGMLDPEAPVSLFLPDSSGVPEMDGVLITHLLSHTSGLSDPPELESLLENGRPWREAVTGQRLHPPGSVFRYSNLGFGLLGCVFEAVTNMKLEDIYQQYLFRPLGMNATMTGASLNPESIMPVIRILPYRPGSEVTVTKLGSLTPGGPDPAVHYGYSAGSMYTDLPSLVKMIECIRDDCMPLVSAGYGKFMKEKTSEYGKASPTLSYGRGLLMIRDNRISESTVFGHQGFAYGCVDGAFWEESTGRILVSLNGGCSEARSGRLGIANFDLCRWSFRKEMPEWKS